MLKLMYITNNPEVALIAEKHGVDRIWVDLEQLGKEKRQHGLDSVKSSHSIGDVAKISKLLTKSEMLVRVNPWNEDSPKEIDQVIEAGAQIIMLPMWKNLQEVNAFISHINGRAKNILLLETREAEDCLDEVLKIDSVDEIHIGLNDLHLSYGLTFMFELLANGTVERICKKIEKAGIPYGFGGIAKIGEGTIPAEKIIIEHYRLGSTMAILSRSFYDCSKHSDVAEAEHIFSTELAKIRDVENKANSFTVEEFEKNRKDIIGLVQFVTTSMKGGMRC